MILYIYYIKLGGEKYFAIYDAYKYLDDRRFLMGRENTEANFRRNET